MAVLSGPRYARVVIAIATLLLARGAAGQASYIVKDLGTLGAGTATNALAINNNGDVVGGSGGRVFLYRNGVVSDLGAPPGFDQAAGFGINSSGQIAVTATRLANPAGFLLDNGAFTNIGNLGTPSVQAMGINDLGQIVGYAATPTGNHVVVYGGGALQDLGNLGASSAIANGINNAGQITGFLNRGSGSSLQFHAYLYGNGTAKDLGTLGGPNSYGNAINNLGQVAGSATLPPLSLGSPPPVHAFLDTNGIMQDLDPGGDSEGLGINDAGDVVGYKGYGGHYYATLWRGGQIINVNSQIQGTSDLTLQAAYAINDSGWIVGSGITASGVQHAFLAIPTPEPSTAALLLLGTALLLRRHRAGRW